MTGTVLGELPERSFVRTVQDLHFDLLGGRTGRAVNGIGAMGLLLMCLTGTVIWWQGLLNWRRGLMIDARRSLEARDLGSPQCRGVLDVRAHHRLGHHRGVFRLSDGFSTTR